MSFDDAGVEAGIFRQGRAILAPSAGLGAQLLCAMKSIETRVWYSCLLTVSDAARSLSILIMIKLDIMLRYVSNSSGAKLNCA